MEREIKLEVLHPELWQEILLHPLIELDKTPAQKLHAIYYDSADGALRTAGIAYRVRREGRRWVATVKLAGTAEGGLHQRPEWNVAVRRHDPDLQVFDAEPLKTLLAPFLGLHLLPVLETAFQRREKEISYHSARILLAADWGEIRAAGKTQPIHEIELELAEGELADLLQLASALCASLPLCPDDASKLARGMALLGEAARVDTSKAPVLRGRAAAGSTLSAVLIAAAHGILSGLVQRQMDSRTDLHALRKEVRALRALLRFCKGMDPDDRLRGVRNGLAVWFHEQSLQRDVDSLAEHWVAIAPRLGQISSPLPETLSYSRLSGRDPRVDSRARLAAELLVLWSQLLRHPLADDETVRSYVEERLQRMDEHLTYVDPEQVAEFHRLRIALKTLRDVLLSMQELWPAKDTKPYTKALHAVLEIVGMIRDAQVAQQHLPQLISGGNAASDLAFHAGILLGYLQARRERESKRLRKHWERFRQATRPWT